MPQAGTLTQLFVRGTQPFDGDARAIDGNAAEPAAATQVIDDRNSGFSRR